MHGASCVWVRPRDMLHMVHIDTGRVMFTWVKESPRYEMASKTIYLTLCKKETLSCTWAVLHSIWT